MLGAAWGGGWGWGCGWGNNDIDVNVNNNFNRNTNISGGNRINNISGGNKWQHNPRYRGGAPYPNRGTADKFGGTARGDSLANRQRAAGKELNRREAISVAPTEGEQATVAVAMALVIAAGQGVEGQIAAEARLESVLPVALRLARAIDLAAREPAALELAEIALESQRGKQFW